MKCQPRFVISSPNPKQIGHIAIMTNSNNACHFDDEGGEIFCNVADFSQKVEMTGANKVCHWYDGNFDIQENDYFNIFFAFLRFCSKKMSSEK